MRRRHSSAAFVTSSSVLLSPAVSREHETRRGVGRRLPADLPRSDAHGVRTFETSSSAVVEVGDTGVGIPPNQVEAIFASVRGGVRSSDDWTLKAARDTVTICAAPDPLRRLTFS